jgi:hypothetical protein
MCWLPYRSFINSAVDSKEKIDQKSAKNALVGWQIGKLTVYR